MIAGYVPESKAIVEGEEDDSSHDVDIPHVVRFGG